MIYDAFKIQKKKSFPKNVKPDGKGKFQEFNGLFIDEVEYNKRKLAETSEEKSRKDQKNDYELKLAVEKYKIIKHFRDKKMTWKEIGESMNVTENATSKAEIDEVRTHVYNQRGMDDLINSSY